MKIFTALLILFLSGTATAATRDNEFNWTHDCETVAGDSLDADGDGICELLTVGWRFYTEAGEFITGIPETGVRSHTVRYNMEWSAGDGAGNPIPRCHYMTAVMDDPVNAGQVLESANSNVAACRNVIPGNPKAPSLTQ